MKTRTRRLPAFGGVHALAGTAVGIVMLALAGCGSEDELAVKANPTANIAVNTPATIAQESADDYNANVSGLITGATLKRWKDDWLTQRPAGITGKLVILQVAAGEAGTEYIKPDNTNVFTYRVPSAEWTQTRSNGVITTISMVSDGPSIDKLLKKYGINPKEDMIVCAMGTASPSNAMAQGRCWYTLRYWGVDGKNLAILNGGSKWQVDSGAMSAADFAAAESWPPDNGTVSVKDLPVDNTALQATLQDMLTALPGADTNVLDDGIFIWDARSIDQYSAGDINEAGTVPVDYMATFQNNGSRQGHPLGALQLNYTNLLVATEGQRYKDKAELQAYLDGTPDGAGKTFVDGTLQPVGVGSAYQPGDVIYTYCETTFRAMITGIASAVVLGKPTRFYDGAMYEWNSLSYIKDVNGVYILPSDSRWRTDTSTRSVFKPALVPPATVAARTIDDPYAASANAIVAADKAYKASSSDSSTGGGTISLPPNPCGG